MPKKSFPTDSVCSRSVGRTEYAPFGQPYTPVDTEPEESSVSVLREGEHLYEWRQEKKTCTEEGNQGHALSPAGREGDGDSFELCPLRHMVLRSDLALVRP